MYRKFLRLSAPAIRLGAVILGLSTVANRGDTYIRPAFGSSKTLLYIDGTSVFADKGGKKLFTIDGERHVCDASGKKLFYINSTGDIHRESEKGILVGVWDGSDLRRTLGSPRIFFAGRYAETKQEFRLKQDQAPVFVLEGDSVNDFQRTALVQQLKPELLAPSQAEEAAANAVVSSAAAKAVHDAASDTVTGDFMVKTVKGPWTPAKMSFAWSKDHLNVQATGAQGLKGVATKFHEISSDHVVGGLAGGKGQIGIFRYANGEYVGQWLAADGDGPIKGDTWKTDGTQPLSSAFTSKQGSLSFTSAHKPLQSEGRTYAVKSDNGQSGYAYQYYDSSENSGLIIALGEASGVFRLYANGDKLIGSYYAGTPQVCTLFMQR